jgi:hypothetical protein
VPQVRLFGRRPLAPPARVGLLGLPRLPWLPPLGLAVLAAGRVTARGPRAHGQCPRCGRVITGRAIGIERLAAERRFVALSPHVRDPAEVPSVWCLTRAEYLTTRRTDTPAPPSAPGRAPARARPPVATARRKVARLAAAGDARGIREAAGLTPAQIARAARVDAAQVLAWEAGQVPDLETDARRYAGLLGRLAAACGYQLSVPVPR